MIDAAAVRDSDWRVVSSATASVAGLHLERSWRDGVCRSTLRNTGEVAVPIREVVLCSLSHAMPLETPAYGEGFQKLSQYGGTVGQRVGLGAYDDDTHYRRPERPGVRPLYNLAVFGANDSASVLFAFATCRRFNGQIRVGDRTLEVVLECEGLELLPGAVWDLEDLVVAHGPDREHVLDTLGSHMAVASAKGATAPTGWCSWYWFWEQVSAADVLRNTAAIREAGLDLEYVQIDDGYQRAIGDWTTPRLGDPDPGELCDRIRAAGRQPAIWVAPFIAEPGSEVLAQHPDWFVSDTEGRPMASDVESFGGWRNGPWSVLDPTHPEVVAHLTRVFEVMRQRWGVRYFKLDALVWGSMWWGRRYDQTVSSVEAYRSILEAIRRAVGDESILVGCNAALWPSLGLVDVMRTTGDIARSWPTIRSCAVEGLSRQWQHRRLWVNDPDCLLLSNQGDSTLTDAELSYLAAFVVGTGGSVFSGDDVSAYTAEQTGLLSRALQPAVGRPTVDPSFEFVSGVRGGRHVASLLNPTERRRRYRLSGPAAVDYWTAEPLGDGRGMELVLEPRSGRVISARDADVSAFALLHSEDA